MDRKINNIIRKSIVDLQFNGNTDGFTLQNDVGDWCHKQFLPTIDNILKKYEGYENIISIDSLEIDVSVDLNSEWLSKINQEIIPLFEKKINSLIVENSESLKTHDTGFMELLSHFLSYGFLPWNNLISTKREFDSRLTGWIQSATDENIYLISSLLVEESIIQRFLNHISPSGLIYFFSRLSGEGRGKIAGILKDARYISEIVDRGKINLLTEFNKTIILQLNITSSENLLSQSIQLWLKKIINIKTGELQKIDSGKIVSPEFINEITLQKINSHFNKGEITNNYSSEDKLANFTSSQEFNTILDEKERVKEKENRPALASPETKEGIYINNAGAVIIAPFLPALFERVSLVNENVITNIDRAVNLINYIITGEENPAEFQLVLPKILCGIPVANLVDTTIKLSRENKKEAKELLDSIIKNWAALKSTSIEGLRESFLLRNGRLSFNNNEWHLLVEQKGYDVLLTQLPWTISHIYLPWMKNILKTDWV